MAQRRIMSMRARIWSAVAWGSGGPPQVRRSSAWITPCGWPVRWLHAPTRPLSSFRSAPRAWRLTGGAAGAACGAGVAKGELVAEEPEEEAAAEVPEVAAEVPEVAAEEPEVPEVAAVAAE